MPNCSATCPLCGSEAVGGEVHRGRTYHGCTVCGSVFMGMGSHPSLDDERARYERHDDDPMEPGHRRFVSPLVEAVASALPEGGLGLDFGSGRGAIVSVMLEERGFTMERFDPFFHPDRSVLEGRYDFVACCEAAEHFREPAREFAMLRTLLREGGILFIMTDLFRPGTDLGSWYYKDDETHMFFYSPGSFEWVRDRFRFRELSISGRVVKLLS